MAIDPFAALHAMVRAEATRTAVPEAAGTAAAAVPEDGGRRAEAPVERPDGARESRRVIGGDPAAS